MLVLKTLMPQKYPVIELIRSDGGLGGYSGKGGIKQKLKLLRSEKVMI